MRSIILKFLLPPTVLVSNASQIQVDNNKIKIASELFTNPNTSVGEPIIVDNNSQSLNDNQSNADDQIERILVRRYIRGVNE